jgi:hypothetical protein
MPRQKKYKTNDIRESTTESKIVQFPKKLNKKRTVNSNDNHSIGDPLYTKNISVDDMDTNNKNFYEKITKKAFVTAFKEEKTYLNELVESTYYPEEQTEKISDLDMMKERLNLIL